MMNARWRCDSGKPYQHVLEGTGDDEGEPRTHQEAISRSIIRKCLGTARDERLHGCLRRCQRDEHERMRLTGHNWMVQVLKTGQARRLMR